MAQTLEFNVRGLYTYGSAVNAPSGSLTEAMNLNISKLGIAEPRRGFDVLASLPASGDRGKRLFSYSDSLFAHYGSTLALYNSGAFVSRGSLSAPNNALSARSVAMNQNLYLASSEGLKKVDDTAENLYQAGIPAGLMIDASLSASTGTAVDIGKFVVYRYTVNRKDANGNLVQGAVSSRTVVENTAGAFRDVDLTVYLPEGLDDSYFAQVYRSANSDAEPGDELQKCYEYPLTSTDVTNGYFTFTDVYPDDLLGDTLYTSPSQQGIQNDNYQPPLAADIAEFKNHLFFADVSSVHRYKFTVVEVSGSGLAADDTITISDGTTTEVYTAKAAADVANKEFTINTASTSPSVRIADSVASLINVINQASALVYAFSESTGSGDLPGKIRLEARSLDGGAFTVVSSRAAAFSPQLQSAANANQTSENDTYRNGLMFSKEGEPEAVPLKNLLFVGSSDDPIKRIVGLRDTLFIFKEKDGCYILTGDNEASFSVTLLDNTAKLVAPETIQALNGYIWGLFETGLCQVSDSGVSIVSNDVKDKFLSLFGQALAETKSVTRCIPYETDGKLILALPSLAGDTYSTYQLVYDVFNQTFCEWNLSLSSGFVNPTDGLLYWCEGDSARVRKEKKTYDYTDYSDWEQDCTLSSYDGLTLTISGTDAMSIGDVLLQDGLQEAYVTAVDTSAGTVTVDIELEWDVGSPITHEKAIAVSMQWTQDFAGNPAGLKHFAEITLLFQRSLIRDGVLSFSTDLNPSVYEVAVAGPDAQNAWGYVPWGSGIWGGGELPQPIRKGVPRGAARGNNLTLGFTHQVAYSDFQLQGFSLVFNPISTRTNR